MRKTLALWTMSVVFAASSAFAAGEARLSGVILDAETKKPVENAIVKYEAVEAKTVKQEVKARKDGNYAAFILDGTIRYKFTYSAPGYTPFEETVKLKLGEPNKRDVELRKAGSGGSAPAGAVPTAAKAADPAIV
ncbi:MAG: hypothetical protein QOH21_3284, partial [Acidobacteriota bacterium]|nr:hypothetical protein [Acidobacteriota bacterium]